MSEEQQDQSSAMKENGANSLKARLGQLEKLLSLEKKARQDAERSLSRMREDAEGQALVVTTLEERLEAAAHDKQEEENRRKAVEERLTLALEELKEERATRNQVQQRLAVALGTRGASKEELLEDHAQMKKSLAESNQRLEWKEQERARLEFQLTEARKLLTQVKGGEAGSALLTERLIDARRRISTLETEKEQDEGKMSGLRREQAELKEHLEEEQALWALREQEFEQEIKRLQAELSGGKLHDLQTQQQALEQELEELKQAASAKRAESEQMGRERRRLEDLLRDKTNELESSRQRVAKLEEKLSASESRGKETRKELEQTQRAYKTLQSQMEQRQALERSQSGGKAGKRPMIGARGAAAKVGLAGSLVGLLLGGALTFGALFLQFQHTGQPNLITVLRGAPVSVEIPGATPPASHPAPVPEPPQAGSGPGPAEATGGRAGAEVAAAQESTEAQGSVAGPVSEPAQAPEPEPEPEAVPTLSEALRDRLRGGGQGPEMVGVPGGVFTMGSERDMLATEEGPEHEVRIRPFYMSRYEITFEEYDRFARATGRPLPDDRGWGRGRLPVIHVSWKDAKDYAQWLSKQTGATYRLPSEAEWEYAARSGVETAFWWGYEVGSNNANCFDCGSSWDFRSTAPVGSFQPNPFGLSDTAGNVQEWVEDCYHKNYEGAPSDGSAWVSGDCRERVTRGGAFDKPAERMRVTSRSALAPELRLGGLGFRVVREP